MRKHFLLLFLLTLLPLAGWSADGDIVDPTGKSGATALTYTGAAQELLQTAGSVEGANYYLYYYVSETEEVPAWNNGTGWTKVSGNVKATDAGTYYVYFTAYNENTQAAPVIGRYVSVKIAQKTLTATVKADAAAPTYFAKDFMAADPEKPVKADVTITGMLSGVSAESLVDVANTIDYEYNGINANADKNGTLFTGNTGYAITFSGITLKTAAKKNYSLTIAPRVMRIKQIALTSTNYAAEAANGKFTVTRNTAYDATKKPVYTGLAHDVSYTVKYYYGDDLENDVYTMQATDVAMKFKSGVDSYPAAVDALDYTPVVSFVANGNFSGTDIALASNAAYNYGIQRANLLVMLNNDSRVYNGYAFLDENDPNAPTPGFNFSQLLGKDAGKAVTGLDITKLEAATGTLTKNAKDYSIKVKQTDAENAEIQYPAVYYTAEEAAAYNSSHNLTQESTDYKTTASVKVVASSAKLSKNYNVIPVAGTWTIDKKAVTVTATADAITYGQQVGTITITAVGGLQIDANNDGDYVDAGDTDENVTIVASFKATTAAAADLKVGENVITVSKKTKSDYDDYNSTTKASATYDTNEAVLANYTIDPLPGTLIVNGVGFTIAPNIAATMEYGTTPAPTYAAFNNTTHAAISTKIAPTYLYRKSTEEASAATTTVPTAVGSYIVSIKQDDNLAPTGYDPLLTSYNETPFTITKKLLDFTIDDVTLHNGDTKTTLNQYGNIKLKDGYALVPGEKLEVEYSFTAAAGLTIGAETADYVISGDEGTTYAAIVASLPEGKANNDNYTLKANVKGNLKIAAGRLLFVDGTDANVNFLIKDAATAVKNAPSNNPITYDVTFADRTLKANEWNVLVLPFAITPLEFCNAKCVVTANTEEYVNDYAVFNVLKSADQSKNSMKFGLTLNEIPANTPFLVKPSKEIKFMRTKVDGETSTNYYLTFTGRKVEYKEVPAVTKDGVNFIGTYKNQTVKGGAKIMYMGADDAGHYTFFTATDNGEAFDINLGSTRAYLDFTGTALGDAAAPTILVEEADGSTTAIVGITADGVAVAAEGWYTINGIKLQGVPTEKGVYINNGKKVVVK